MIFGARDYNNEDYYSFRSRDSSGAKKTRKKKPRLPEDAIVRKNVHSRSRKDHPSKIYQIIDDAFKPTLKNVGKGSGVGRSSQRRSRHKGSIFDQKKRHQEENQKNFENVRNGRGLKTPSKVNKSGKGGEMHSGSKGIHGSPFNQDKLAYTQLSDKLLLELDHLSLTESYKKLSGIVKVAILKKMSYFKNTPSSRKRIFEFLLKYSRGAEQQFIYDFSIEKDALSLKVLAFILYAELDQALKSCVNEKGRLTNLLKKSKKSGNFELEKEGSASMTFKIQKMIEKMESIRKEDSQAYEHRLQAKDQELESLLEEVTRKKETIDRLYSDRALFIKGCYNINYLLIELHDLFLEMIKAVENKNFDYFFRQGTKLTEFQAGGVGGVSIGALGGLGGAQGAQNEPVFTFSRELKNFIFKIQKLTKFLQWAKEYENEDDTTFLRDPASTNFHKTQKKNFDKSFKTLDKTTIKQLQKLIESQQALQDQVNSLKKRNQVLEERIKANLKDHQMKEEATSLRLSERQEQINKLQLKIDHQSTNLAKMEVLVLDLKDKMMKGIVEENRASNREANKRVSDLLSKLKSGLYFSDIELEAKGIGVDSMYRDQMDALKVLRDRLKGAEDRAKKREMESKIKVDFEVSERAKHCHDALDVFKMLKEVIYDRDSGFLLKFLLLVEPDINNKIRDAKNVLAVARNKLGTSGLEESDFEFYRRWKHYRKSIGKDGYDSLKSLQPSEEFSEGEMRTMQVKMEAIMIENETLKQLLNQHKILFRYDTPTKKAQKYDRNYFTIFNSERKQKALKNAERAEKKTKKSLKRVKLSKRKIQMIKDELRSRGMSSHKKKYWGPGGEYSSLSYHMQCFPEHQKHLSPKKKNYRPNERSKKVRFSDEKITAFDHGTQDQERVDSRYGSQSKPKIKRNLYYDSREFGSLKAKDSGGLLFEPDMIQMLHAQSQAIESLLRARMK